MEVVGEGESTEASPAAWNRPWFSCGSEYTDGVKTALPFPMGCTHSRSVMSAGYTVALLTHCDDKGTSYVCHMQCHLVLPVVFGTYF